MLEEIKDGLNANAWNDAVVAARDGSVVLHAQEGQKSLFNVTLRRPLPFRVELDLQTGYWDCPCKGATCAHAAAAALLLIRMQKTGGTPQPVPSLARTTRLAWRLSLDYGRWQLTPLVVLPDGDEHPLPLASAPPIGTRVDAADEQLLELRRSGITVERIMPMLHALALCADVRVEARSVRVKTDAVAQILVVEDHPSGGIQVKLGTKEPLVQTLEASPTLVIVGDPPTLRPLGRSSLPLTEAELYRRGRTLTGQAAFQFMAETLPRLTVHTQVDVRTRMQAPKPVALRPYARLSLFVAEGGFDAVPSITYGKPPVAVVVENKLHTLGSQKVMIQRQTGLEGQLASRIERLGFTPGHRKTLRGLDAIRFAQQVLPSFPGEIEHPEVAQTVRLFDRAVQPRFEPKGDTLALTFSLVPEASKGKTAASPSTLELTERTASPEAILDAWKNRSPIVALMEGGFARLPQDWLERYGDVLEALMEVREAGHTPTKRILEARLLEHTEVVASGKTLREALLARSRMEAIAPPSTLRASLRDYQLEGLRWLKHLETSSLNGILADDMGLGKTVQTLALLLLDPPEAGPTLVVAPTSVLDNWKAEALKFAPSIRAHIHHGGERSVEALTQQQLIITSYALLRRDAEALRDVRWHRVILDEAQAIKNPDSQTAKVARSLPAAHRLCLTGTPVENRLLELWSLLEFLNPGILGTKSRFEALYPTGSGVSAGTVRRLRARVQPFILRRLKQDVAKELPGKTELVLKATLSREERRIYEAVRSAGLKEVQSLMNQGGIKRHALHILEILLRLRQAACHPGLVPGGREFKGTSAKLSLLVEQLEVVVEEGHRALVFSQWTSLLDRVEPVLREAGLSWVRLDGSTQDRGAVVERFQHPEGPPVFLLSLKAGGTGLNLTAADYVFHLDPWWNPAAEEQATDRAYRIGQTRPVVVTKLIAAGSIEERVLELQRHKRSLAEAALGGDADWLENLSQNELEELLAS